MKALVSTFSTALLLSIGVSSAHAQIVTIDTTSDYARIRGGGALSTGTNAVRYGTNGGDRIFTGYVIFDISSLTTEITDASFTFTGQSSTGNPGAGTLTGIGELSLYSDGTMSDNTSSERATYITATGTTLGAFDAGGYAANTSFDYDVTSFLETRRLAGDTFVSFRFSEDTSSFDSIVDQQLFLNDSFTLTATVAAIPEPSTFAVFAGVLAIGLSASRRRSS